MDFLITFLIIIFNLYVNLNVFMRLSQDSHKSLNPLIIPKFFLEQFINIFSNLEVDVGLFIQEHEIDV